jgi:tyrosyl-tRNA synthetase
MVMQGFDFFHLHQNEKCALQIGGDDQWSNMLAGIDLIHKKTGEEAFALTLPLLLNSDGTKMGKTEKGAVWLSEEGPTSIFDFFQFWRNLPDTEVIKCFKMLTFLSLEEIESLPFSTVVEINSAKKMLAHAITEIVHGKVAADATLEMVEALFESRDSSAIEATQIDDGIQLLDLLVTNGFAKSRTDARNLINGKGIAINDQIIETPNLVIARSQFGSELTIRKGKKNFGRFVIKEPNA